MAFHFTNFKAFFAMQEKLILSTLHFNMAVPTPYVFMKRLLKVAQSDEETDIIFFLHGAFPGGVHYVEISTLIFVVAVVYTAQCTLKIIPCWNGSIECNFGNLPR